MDYYSINKNALTSFFKKSLEHNEYIIFTRNNQLLLILLKVMRITGIIPRKKYLNTTHTYISSE